jgi:hypothetical protein
MVYAGRRRHRGRGGHPKTHPLTAALRGWAMRVEAGLTAFRLASTGRPLPSPPERRPLNALEQLRARTLRSVETGPGPA